MASTPVTSEPSQRSDESPRTREWATRTIQWQPARNAVKYGVHAYARARGRRLERGDRVPPIANIYTAGPPKAGSQWMKALFDHPVVREKTGLFTLPQLDYQLNPERGLPAGTFVPGIYMSYSEYERIPKPLPHRTIYMFRDPRELVISGYYAATLTHRYTNRETEKYRSELRTMPFDEGLLDLIYHGERRLRDMATWVEVDDQNVAKFRLEDVSADPGGHIPRMLEHCDVSLSPDELETVLGDVSRDSLQTKDLAQRKGGNESHYRVSPQSFRELFKPEHHQAIEEIVPGLAARLGYTA
jgi:hypothetical protein